MSLLVSADRLDPFIINYIYCLNSLKISHSKNSLQDDDQLHVLQA